MKIARLPHYMKRFKELGPRKAAEVFTHRIQSSFFEQYARYQADQKKAAVTWPLFAQKFKLGDFETFFTDLKKRSLSMSESLYTLERSDKQTLKHQATAFAHHCFDILGSREQCLMTLPWHSDFRLRYQNTEADYLFDKNTFYKDYTIQAGLTDRLTKDIKVPWELARLQHIFVMGAAYQEGKDPLYARAFEQHVSDFIEENPYLLGPNWVCPMDVGIRALNLIWGFHFFKDAPDIDQNFWQTFVCSLYDHMHYLENNWEVFGVTSNHYLSDLIGYFYCTWLFRELPGIEKRHMWCYKELLKEFEKQVFEEGSNYEGSTNYHKLVTEIFYHFYLICQESNISLPGYFLKKLKSMFSFIDWCAINDTQLVKIGDDDSGKILFYGLSRSLVTHMQETCAVNEKFYKQFGLAIRKDANWHVTLRHHAYTINQPSGHFHNDIASITVAVRGIPVIVDPGSYVYTPSTVWRNAFRSVQMHNTFYLNTIEPVPFSERSLFMLDMPERILHEQEDPWSVSHNLYGVPAQRSIHFDDTRNTIILSDTWEKISSQGFVCSWNFTLDPAIMPVYKDGIWHCMYQEKTILTIASYDLDFSLERSWYAPSYGIKIDTTCLRAKTLVTDQPVKIIIQQHGDAF